MGAYRVGWTLVVGILVVAIFQEFNELGFQLSRKHVGLKETPISSKTTNLATETQGESTRQNQPMLAPSYIPRPQPDPPALDTGQLGAESHALLASETTKSPAPEVNVPTTPNPTRPLEHTVTGLGLKAGIPPKIPELKPEHEATKFTTPRSLKMTPGTPPLETALPVLQSEHPDATPRSRGETQMRKSPPPLEVITTPKTRASGRNQRRQTRSGGSSAPRSDDPRKNATLPSAEAISLGALPLPTPSSSGKAVTTGFRHGDSLEKIRSRQGIILFTHIRRAGGTVLEDYVLKPFVAAQGKQRKDYLCKEGELGRFYRMRPPEQKKHVPALSAAALQWRHCPFGLHALLPPTTAHLYITMLREPVERMLSWYAYCDKYSPNKCHAGKAFASQGKPGESTASRFYSSRRKLYEQGKAAFDASINGGGAGVVGKPGSVSGTFHPNNLEYRLDDNYQTRMVCGPAAHDRPIPIGAKELACAQGNLEEHYAFVATTERYAESICVLAALVHISPKQLRNVKNDKATTSKGAQSKRGSGGGGGGGRTPSDFEQNWGAYAAHDKKLHAEANRRLDVALEGQPQCRGAKLPRQ